MTFRSWRASTVALALATTACGGGDNAAEPRPVAGDYTMFLTAGANSCPFEDWVEGVELTDVALTITQIDTNVVATIGDPIDSFLMTESGSSRFTGALGDTEMVLDIVGDVYQLEGNCTFTINATLDTRTDVNDFLHGVLRYRGATNGNPDCAPIEGCEAIQAFNATRPPSAPGLTDAGVPISDAGP